MLRISPHSAQLRENGDKNTPSFDIFYTKTDKTKGYPVEGHTAKPTPRSVGREQRRWAAN